MEPIIERSFTVSPFAVGPDRRLRVTALLDVLQQVAGEHADGLGVGMDWLAKQRTAWFAARYHLRLGKLPLWKRPLTVRSWPSGEKRLLAFRDFEVRDEDGTLVAAVISTWILVDLDSRRPRKPGDVFEPYPKHRAHVFDADPPPLLAPDREDVVRHYAPLRDHIDVNRHVNNAVYLAWTLDCVPDAVGDELRPAEIEIAFKGETRYGERVRGVTRCDETPTGFVTVHRLADEATDRDLVLQRTRWERD